MLNVKCKRLAMESTCTLFCQNWAEIARFGGDSDLAVLHGRPISLYRAVKPPGAGYELVGHDAAVA